MVYFNNHFITNFLENVPVFLAMTTDNGLHDTNRTV